MRRQLRVHDLPRDREAGIQQARRVQRAGGGFARQGAGLTPTSRLGCQAVIEDPNAEIVITVPRYTINQVSEAAEE